MTSYPAFLSDGQQQCRYCRAIIRMLPFPASAGTKIRWGAFVDVPPVWVTDAIKHDGKVYVMSPDAKSVVGPFTGLKFKLPLAIPHDCPNR